jgi:hypothetical protein
VFEVLVKNKRSLIKMKLKIKFFIDIFLDDHENKMNNSLRKLEELKIVKKNEEMNTMFDVFHRRMDDSDPILASMRISKLQKPSVKNFPEKVSDIILLPKNDINEDSCDEDSEDDVEDVLTCLNFHLDQTELENEIDDGIQSDED